MAREASDELAGGTLHTREAQEKVKGPSRSQTFILGGHRHPWLYRAYNLARICFSHQHRNSSFDSCTLWLGRRDSDNSEYGNDADDLARAARRRSGASG